MNKKLIRLTESDLHRIVKESVQKILKEDFKHNKEQKRLYQNAVFPSDRHMADEYGDIQYKIKDGLDCLSWLLPNNMEMKRFGIQPRVSKEISNAVQILQSNYDTILDAVMNAYTEYLDKGHYLQSSNIDKDITNGKSLQDRFEDYYGDGQIENDFDRRYDNDLEY